jgi:uncharacterized protein (TIGR04141 family)
MCENLLRIYESDEHKKTFADIQNVMPVKDPKLVERLFKELIGALRTRSEKIALAVPEIIDYKQGFSVSFAGTGPSALFDDATIDAYYTYLQDADYPISHLTVEEIKRQQLHVNDEDDEKRHAYSILKCLLFDTALDDDQDVIYHLTEGQWYRVGAEFLKGLTDYLDHRCVDVSLPACDARIEEDYNLSVSKSKNMVCLDKTNVSPRLQTQIEPCDLYDVVDGKAVLIHVKISTDSTALSHLFNQGANSVELLKSEELARQKLSDLVATMAGTDREAEMTAPIRERHFRVVYAIISKKSASGRSGNLPLFSRISLRRNLRALDLMDVPASYGFVKDDLDRSSTRERSRKRRSNKSSE